MNTPPFFSIQTSFIEQRRKEEKYKSNMSRQSSSQFEIGLDGRIVLIIRAMSVTFFLSVIIFFLSTVFVFSFS